MLLVLISKKKPARKRTLQKETQAVEQAPRKPQQARAKEAVKDVNTPKPQATAEGGEKKAPRNAKKNTSRPNRPRKPKNNNPGNSSDGEKK